MLETLEGRRLMSTTPDPLAVVVRTSTDPCTGVTSATLLVGTDNGDDKILIAQNENGSIDVYINGELFDDQLGGIPQAPVPISLVEVSTGNGNDRVEFRSFSGGPPVTGFISTGNGSDTVVVTGSAVVTFQGGRGDDTLLSPNGNTNVLLI